jgi:hypothetical protein
MKWKGTPSPTFKKFKSEPSVSKAMLMLLWDINEPILKKYEGSWPGRVTSALLGD